MRFVNCARSEEEQCVTAYQHQGEVYYRAHKDIHPGTELLVSQVSVKAPNFLSEDAIVAL